MCILIAIMLKCLDGRGAIEILTVSFPVNIIEEILPFTDYQFHKVFILLIINEEYSLGNTSSMFELKSFGILSIS